MMTQKQREKLIYIKGTFQGLFYAESDPTKADCFIQLQEKIDKLLKEDEKE